MDDVRVYGDVSGFSAEDFEEIRHSLPFEKIVYEDGVLSVDYEGHYIDIDDFLDEIKNRLDSKGWAKVDYIDHVEWKLTRYEMIDGKFTERVVNVDAVLEPTKNEAGQR
ncbi:hypothetical protein [Maridesulfovibrio bastinii]|uniref:hypothetical protein n=1 Tax=Maridesulfovibrio bastinii TaxID=47157 RepID=UPI000417F0E4|nr:hypothetical protein [Maridesulfovibrio bastinii]